MFGNFYFRQLITIANYHLTTHMFSKSFDKLHNYVDLVGKPKSIFNPAATISADEQSAAK